MWILSILSDAMIHAIFGLGIFGIIAGFVLGFIPVIKPYKLAIQICSILTLALGVYLEGGLADHKIWELRVKDMEVKVAEDKARGAEKNLEIQEKVVEKTKVVHEKGKDIIKYIDREVVKNEEVIKYIERCPVIPASIIEEHNKAATK
jgi:hypothetical protein